MKMRLISKVSDLEDVCSFIFEPERPIGWLPGQYMHYTLNHPGADERGVQRWFTIASAPFEKNIRITTRLAAEKGSSFKKALVDLNEGDIIEAEGPKGQFTLEEGDYRHILVAGGIGITPYRSMMLQMHHDNMDFPVELFYANRDDKPVFGEVLTSLQGKLKNFHIRYFIGEQRIKEADFAPYLGMDNSIFYISGPRPLVENYQHMLQALKVPDTRIKTDYFPGYND